MVSPLNTVSVSRSVGRFMDNLQTEVLEIEFLSYSKGMTTISEEDFARILLRYTVVENIAGYLENVRHSIPDEKVLLLRTWFWTHAKLSSLGKIKYLVCASQKIAAQVPYLDLVFMPVCMWFVDTKNVGDAGHLKPF